jgi:hypothetical protein
VDKRKDLNPLIQLDTDPDAIPMPPGQPEGWTPEEISFYFERALKVLNTDDFTTAKEYIDLLVNQCLAERHWSDAFTHFLTKVKEMGLEIETDQAMLRNLNERMFYWRTVRMMIHAAGLLRYEEEIMKYEIAKFYQPPPIMLPQPRTREVPLERPRRKPARETNTNSVLRPAPAAKSQPAPAKERPPAAARINKPVK